MNGKNKKVIYKYILIAYYVTWLLWGIVIFANQFGYLQVTSIGFSSGTFLYMTLLGIGGCGPAISAIILLSKIMKVPMKQIFKNIFEVRQPVFMYLLTLGFLTLYFLVGTLTGFMEYNGTPIYLALLSFPIMIVGGGLEEIGWRFLQPELEKKMHFSRACSITAVVWAVWHLPLFFMEGMNQASTNFLLFTIMVFGLAFTLAAIYYVSKSVWLCILFHTLTNCLYESFSPSYSDISKDLVPGILTTTTVMIIASILVVNIAKKRQRSNT